MIIRILAFSWFQAAPTAPPAHDCYIQPQRCPTSPCFSPWVARHYGAPAMRWHSHGETPSCNGPCRSKTLPEFINDLQLLAILVIQKIMTMTSPDWWARPPFCRSTRSTRFSEASSELSWINKPQIIDEKTKGRERTMEKEKECASGRGGLLDLRGACFSSWRVHHSCGYPVWASKTIIVYAWSSKGLIVSAMMFLYIAFLGSRKSFPSYIQ